MGVLILYWALVQAYRKHMSQRDIEPVYHHTDAPQQHIYSSTTELNLN